jgi:hypothetical protein
MLGDRLLTASQAADLHAEMLREGVLLLWTITRGTFDYAEHYVARPHQVGKNRSGALSVYLIADDLGTLRRLLPPSLTYLGRDPADDPVIIETWL